MVLFLIACATKEIGDTAAADTDLVDSGYDTAQPAPVRPEALQGFYIDNGRYPKAVCNDGSTPIFYMRPGVNEGQDRWVLWFEGGGSCFSVETCTERWQSERNQMSTCVGEDCTDYAADTEKIKSGILSALVEENPHLHEWNHVLLNYCSSDAWLGQREAPLNAGPLSLYFRGHHVAEAVLSTLLEEPVAAGYPTLSDASAVILSGSSAGGTGMRGHVDAFADRLAFADVHGLSDSTMVPIVIEAGDRDEHGATAAEDGAVGRLCRSKLQGREP